MLKLIYLAKRRPGFTADAFTRRWRQHGALGMSTAFWRHALAYTQAEPLRPALADGLSADYDAVTYLMVKDDTFTGPATDEDKGVSALLAGDELKTFSSPIPAVSLFVKAEILKAGDLGGYTGFFFYDDNAAAKRLATALAGDPKLDRVILNVRDDTGLGRMGNTLPYVAIVEAATHGRALLREVLVAHAAGFSGAKVAVATQEAVLWDRL